MSETADPHGRGSQAYLPDFCAASTVFVIVLIAELVAIVLTLAGNQAPGQFLIELSHTSFFVLWFALLGCAVMCRLRARLEGAGSRRAFVLSFYILLGLCLLLAEISWQLTQLFSDLFRISSSHGTFVFRTFATGAIVIALAMRYLYVSSEWRRSIVLEAQARISALQALIRPHFLFNSMNTIASLTRTDPKQAEEAVEDLSDLLRANLGSSKDRTSLKQELEIAAIYQRIEKLRLGDRLSVRWDVGELPMRALIPSLVIQPLLENAIYHGIELLPDGGEVTVSGKREDDYLTIEISNPVARDGSRKQDGNKMAMSNIRQRFELAYGNRAEVDVIAGDDRFAVRLRFPEEHPA
ncbi:MAG: histidine kinase [Woeseiaceae bacterium]|nr:histidine kinase [Woeseiaceae bacterium]